MRDSAAVRASNREVVTIPEPELVQEGMNGYRKPLRAWTYGRGKLLLPNYGPEGMEQEE